jgi:hypothetical protein
VKPKLTVQKLVRAGFQQVGCWELNTEQKLTLRIELPARAGVYAFAMDGVVQYVGLASKSLHQRIGHYRMPGPSQTTNIRLNDLICGKIEQGAVVEILIGHPPDHDWRGLKIRGSEGLEAGLIAEFELPWNVKGAAKKAELNPKSRGQSNSTSRILNIVRRRPGMTELEIARAMYGPSAVQQQVNADCRLLVDLRLVERCGVGGRGDPFVYRMRS